MNNFNTGFQAFLDDLQKEMESPDDMRTDQKVVNDNEEDMKDEPIKSLDYPAAVVRFLDHVSTIYPHLGPYARKACDLCIAEGRLQGYKMCQKVHQEELQDALLMCSSEVL